jgi:hypothetical protein
MKKYAVFTFFLLSIWMLSACGGNKRKYVQNPVDKLIKQLSNDSSVKTFSIILEDMELDNDGYKHKYKVLTNLEDSVNKKIQHTEWMPVEEAFFVKHEENLGLELAGMDESGEVHKVPTPPGYRNYVGNERYGEWRTNSNGQSFWAFYGQYMFMSSMFHMMAAPVYRNHYDTYRGSYYNSGRPYYGPRTASGSYTYGTSGSVTRTTNPSFHSRYGSTSSFKSKLRSRVQQSQSRTTRSSNRSSSSGSSYRSRGGSYGK